MAPILGYWDSRGYAQSIRLLLAQAGVEFTDRRYVRGPGPDFAPDPEWIRDKTDGLGLDFPNIPYFLDGDVRISQSMAISRYLARMYGLIARSEEGAIRQDIAEYQLLDFRTVFVRLAHHEYTDETRANYLSNILPGQLKALSKFLGTNDWLAEDKQVNFVDLMMYDILDWHLYFEPSCLDGFPNLKEHMKRVENLPNIRSWMETGNYKPWPLFGTSFRWGYQKSDQYLRFPELRADE